MVAQGKNAGNPVGLPSILTQRKRKSASQNRSSDYSLSAMDNCVGGGVRVDDIAKRVNLSRPAVSHHLKLLMDENIVTFQKAGTKNYYHITGGGEILKLKSLINSIEEFMNDEVNGL